MVPGMGHGVGATGAENFNVDTLALIEQWKQTGKAPNQLVMSHYKDGKEMGKRLAEVLAANSDLHLVTDGKSIFLEDQHDRIIDILKNARQPMFLVSVSDQARRLTESERKPARMEPGVTTRRAA